jgi:hypothetical protein
VKRYPSGLITADPVTLGSSSNGYIVSSTDQLQYNFSGVWPIAPLPPFPTYTSLSYSNSFDGTGDYLSIPSNPNLAFGTGDFTVEAWVNWSSISAPRPIIDMQSSGSFNLYWDNGAFNVNSLVVSDRTANQIVYSFLPTIGTWYHIAVSRSGTNLRLFVNGILVSTAASNTTNYAAGISHIGGDTGTSWYHNGYISNLRVVKGQAVYTGNFTVPTSPLAITQSSSSNVSSIINTIPSNGNSVYFDGTGDYLSVGGGNMVFAGDFTIECWVYPARSSYVNYIGILGGSSGNFVPIYVMSNGTLEGGIWGSSNIVNSSLAINLNQWNHIALVRSGSSLRFYINGVQDTASTNSSTLTIVNPTIATTPSVSWLGYISNMRVVNGTAVYTASFTPPTAPLTAITNTSLLTCQSSTIVDNSSSPLTITVNGDTKVALTDSPFGFSNVKLLTAQSPTVIDNSLANNTIAVNGDTKALALSPFDTTLQTAYLAVAGGGGGGGQGGGGGAGGLLYRTNLILIPNVTYTITIGAGGTTSAGSSFGSDSKITNAGFAANITAIGGGAGQSRDISVPGGVGGSGGGGGAGAAGGNATGQAGTPGQGNAGAPGGFPSGGGGGGGAGGTGNGGSPYAGNGGIGVYLTISGSNVAYAGGGGGGGVAGYNSGGGAGGIGGGGGGQNGLTGGGGFPGGTLSTTAAPGTYGPGAINTGGGGGGAAYLGGSGIVILASNIYQASNVTGNPNVTYDYGNSVAIYRFWQSGTIKW